MSEPIRVLTVDDHAFLVEGLQARLAIESDLEFVGRCPSADTLVETVRRTDANIVLLDIEMPGADPFEAIDDLRRQCPDTRVIMLSAYVRDHYIDAAYKAGAWGYLSKGDSSDDVVSGIRNVAAGQLAFSPQVQKRANAPTGRRNTTPASSKLSLLTEREQQVLRMIARGMGRAEIAETLCRSPMTVDNHRKSIMKKLDIKDRVELARFAIAEGLVEV
ncbi:MAG: response regulator transcription factor [Phycisphaerales bacterium]|nr:response regulator transcription factor [Phycisphaerae bacterium]NNM24557.1 response regulator transcription factor [Phycisphaerales bacterium]